MSQVISTHSFRGGTGKSNTTANLAALTAKAGYRVGVIDTDIQSPGIHVLFQLGRERIGSTLNDYLWGKCAAKDAAYDVSLHALGEQPESDRSRIFLIPSSIRTGEIARILREGYDVHRLNEGFQELQQSLALDYLFIDTHPGVNEETLLSIAVSDSLILMVRPDQQDFQGTAVTVELARKLEVPDMFMVINKVPEGTDVSALISHVTNIFSVDVAAALPLSIEMAKIASSDLFCNVLPDHPLTKSLRTVVRRIVHGES